MDKYDLSGQIAQISNQDSLHEDFGAKPKNRQPLTEPYLAPEP